jgi:hypothetical protein
MFNSGSANLANILFINNRADSQGGGFHNAGGDVDLRSVVFTGNVAYTGAGVCNVGRATVANGLFVGNIAKGNYGDGGGWSNWVGSEATLSNCTLFGNQSQKGKGGALGSAGNLTVRNCIIWGNSAKGADQIGIEAGSCTVQHTDIQGGPNDVYVRPGSILNWGTGNIDADPCFVQPSYWDINDVWIEGDYHLLGTSPCIDTGDPNYVAGPNETDLDGNPRVVNSIIDMGAYEVQVAEPADLIAELLEEVGGLGLPGGIENSLMAKLNAALRALEDENENNDAAAVNTLEAFINAVETHRGKKIPEAEADALIAAAQEIIELLGDS